MSAAPETECLTVKEAADAFGVSVQAVYQRLDKDFKPYLKVIDGKKRLDKRVLELNNKEEISSGLTSDFKEILKLLEKQLNEKDRQLAEKDRQISELTETVKTQAQTINADRQKDLAGKIIEGKQLLAGDGDLAAPPKKRGVFARVFGKGR
jgi:ERCC4-related helicase